MNLIVLTSDQLQGMLDSVVQKVESIIKDSQKKEITSKEWLTSKEVCEILKISHTTLHDWINKGIIQRHQLGISRIRFRYDEVLETLQRRESKRR